MTLNYPYSLVVQLQSAEHLLFDIVRIFVLRSPSNLVVAPLLCVKLDSHTLRPIHDILTQRTPSFSLNNIHINVTCSSRVPCTPICLLCLIGSVSSVVPIVCHLGV
jgi:hypothetical protein